MKTCGYCGAQAVKFTRLEKHLCDLSGIKVELVESAFKLSCHTCGDGILIPDQEGLIAAVAVTRAHMPIKLNGMEIRFMRKSAGNTAVQLAKLIDVTPETVSRWEGDKLVISQRVEKLLRLYVADSLSEAAPAVDLDLKGIMRMDINPIRNELDLAPLQFELVKLKADKAKRPHWDYALEALAA